MKPAVGRGASAHLTNRGMSVLPSVSMPHFLRKLRRVIMRSNGRFITYYSIYGMCVNYSFVGRLDSWHGWIVGLSELLDGCTVKLWTLPTGPLLPTDYSAFACLHFIFSAVQFLWTQELVIYVSSNFSPVDVSSLRRRALRSGSMIISHVAGTVP